MTSSETYENVASKGLTLESPQQFFRRIVEGLVESGRDYALTLERLEGEDALTLIVRGTQSRVGSLLPSVSAHTHLWFFSNVVHNIINSGKEFSLTLVGERITITVQNTQSGVQSLLSTETNNIPTNPGASLSPPVIQDTEKPNTPTPDVHSLSDPLGTVISEGIELGEPKEVFWNGKLVESYEEAGETFYHLDRLLHIQTPYIYNNKKIIFSLLLESKGIEKDGKKYYSLGDIILFGTEHNQWEELIFRGKRYYVVGKGGNVEVNGSMIGCQAFVRRLMRDEEAKKTSIECMGKTGFVLSAFTGDSILRNVYYEDNVRIIREGKGYYLFNTKKMVWNGIEFDGRKLKRFMERNKYEFGEECYGQGPNKRTMVGEEIIIEFLGQKGLHPQTQFEQPLTSLPKVSVEEGEGGLREEGLQEIDMTPEQNITETDISPPSTTPLSPEDTGENKSEITIQPETQPINHKLSTTKDDIGGAGAIQPYDDTPKYTQRSLHTNTAPSQDIVYPSPDLLRGATLPEVQERLTQFLTSLTGEQRSFWNTYDGHIRLLENAGYDGNDKVEIIRLSIHKILPEVREIHLSWKTITEFRQKIRSMGKKGEKIKESNAIVKIIYDERMLFANEQSIHDKRFCKYICRILPEHNEMFENPLWFHGTFALLDEYLGKILSMDDTTLRGYDSGLEGIMKFMHQYGLTEFSIKRLIVFIDKGRIDQLVPSWMEFLDITLSGYVINKKIINLFSGLRVGKGVTYSSIVNILIHNNFLNIRLDHVCKMINVFRDIRWSSLVHPRISLITYHNLNDNVGSNIDNIPVYILEFLASIEFSTIQSLLDAYKKNTKDAGDRPDENLLRFSALIELWKKGYIVPNNEKTVFICTHPHHAEAITKYLSLPPSKDNLFPINVAQEILNENTDKEKEQGYQPKDIVSETGMKGTYNTLFGENKGAVISGLDRLKTDPQMRPMQRGVFEAIQSMIINDQVLNGYIKMPTGSGKTRIFANLIRLFQLNTIVLVPRTPLLSQTEQALLGAGVKPESIRVFTQETPLVTLVDQLKEHLNQGDDSRKKQDILVLTYQTFIAFIKKQSEQQKKLLATRYPLIIEDEAHRAVGAVMTECRKQFIDGRVADGDTCGDVGDDDTYTEGEDGEMEVSSLHTPLFLRFTATPRLGENGNNHHGEEIYNGTIEQAVREGSIVLPQVILTEPVYRKTYHGKETYLTENNTLYETDMIERFLNLRASCGGNIKTLVLARSIEHAQEVVRLFAEKNIRATRVTVDYADISTDEAVKQLESGETEVIVTVMKVAEGFDYPKFQCMINMARVSSPTKLVQVMGRIMRATPEKLPVVGGDMTERLPLSPNTYIIAPEKWITHSDNERYIRHYYPTIIELGEIPRERLPLEIEEMYFKSGFLHGNEYEYNGKTYIALDQGKDYKGLSSMIIIQKARSMFIEIKKRENSFTPSVYLIRKDYVQEIINQPVIKDIKTPLLIRRIEYITVENNERKTLQFLETVKSEPVEALDTRGNDLRMYPYADVITARLCSHGTKVEFRGKKHFWVGPQGIHEYIHFDGGKNVLLRTCYILAKHKFIDATKHLGLFLISEEEILKLWIDRNIGHTIIVGGVPYSVQTLNLRKEALLTMNKGNIYITHDGHPCRLVIR